MSSKSLIDFLKKRPFSTITALALASTLAIVPQSIKRSNPARLNDALKNRDTLRMYWQIEAAHVGQDEFTRVYLQKTGSEPNLTNTLQAGAMFQSIVEFGDAVEGFLRTGTDRASLKQSLNLIKVEFMVHPYDRIHFDIIPITQPGRLKPDSMQNLYSQTELSFKPVGCEVSMPFFIEGRDKEIIDAAVELAEKQFNIADDAKPDFQRQIIHALENYEKSLKVQCLWGNTVIHHGVRDDPTIGLITELKNNTVNIAAETFRIESEMAARKANLPRPASPLI